VVDEVGALKQKEDKCQKGGADPQLYQGGGTNHIEHYLRRGIQKGGSREVLQRMTKEGRPKLVKGIRD